MQTVADLVATPGTTMRSPVAKSSKSKKSSVSKAPTYVDVVLTCLDDSLRAWIPSATASFSTKISFPNLIGFWSVKSMGVEPKTEKKILKADPKAVIVRQ